MTDEQREKQICESSPIYSTAMQLCEAMKAFKYVKFKSKSNQVQSHRKFLNPTQVVHASKKKSKTTLK